MGFWSFGKKRDLIEEVHSKLNNSFSNIKKDFTKVSVWINHLDDHRKRHDERISRVEEKIGILEELLYRLQEKEEFKQVFKHKQTGRLNKQPFKRVFKQGEIDEDNELGGMLDGLTVMERAALWVLLNTEMKLSYEDLAVALGKNKNTVRVQLNNIKKKCPGLISESLDNEGRKRLHIEDEDKEDILKTVKIRQIKAKKSKSES